MKIGFVEAVQTAARRDLYEGQWMDFTGPVEGRNELEQACERLTNAWQYLQDEVTDQCIMRLRDHALLCHLTRDGVVGRGHPAYYREARKLGIAGGGK